MKQGSGKTTVAGGKIEPRSQGYNTKAVGEIGLQVQRTKPIQVYEGRGIHAPLAGHTTHKSGSQGKHK
jgi:hypothetical protein